MDNSPPQGQSVTLPEIAVVGERVPEMGYLVPNTTIATTTDTPILDMCRCGRAAGGVATSALHLQVAFQGS